MAVWLDDLSRELLASGQLQLFITSRHVVGVTTNPTIFASALAKGDRYDDQLRDLAEAGAGTATAIFTVTTDDVRTACDVLAPVYQQTAARDGRVSIEVDPRLARDTAATADMARALRSAVDRDNMFVKIPATPEGLTAITQVTSEGISVNVTLIFALGFCRFLVSARSDSNVDHCRCYVRSDRFRRLVERQQGIDARVGYGWNGVFRCNRGIHMVVTEDECSGEQGECASREGRSEALTPFS